ncbi:MAG: ribosomal protein S18-alanine N-acetyltransferase [Actinomycetes bacterium]|jgi:ribosomal-protein-alanine N-acetyltransferase
MEIAPLKKKDLRSIVAIEKASFPEPWSEALLRSELDAGESRRYTKAVIEKNIVGYLGLMFVDDEVHVNTLAVLPDARGKGVASRLLLDGIRASLERAAIHMTLEVAVTNEGAQGLYRRFGMAPVGVRRGYYAQGEDALVMWARDLDSEIECARRDVIAESLGLTL